MIYYIENDFLKAGIAAQGAELQSIIDKKKGIEYMWSGDTEFWAKKSPVLFPIVGTLKENTFYYNHNAYHLPRHGFARTMLFKLVKKDGEGLVFSITSNEDTLKVYPFEFELQLIYTLYENQLKVTYKVINPSKENIYFSIGAHPAFKVPIFEGDNYNDYRLEFNKIEQADRWPISGEGLIETLPVPFLNNEQIIPLKKDLFYKDAIVFKHLESDTVKLISVKNNNGIEFGFKGFPFLGIWAAKDADFVCIEPWCGIADSTDSNRVFIEKEGINALDGGDFFERFWTVRIVDN